MLRIFYEQLTPVAVGRHGEVGFNAAADDRFACSAQQLPIALSAFLRAAATLPRLGRHLARGGADRLGSGA